MGIFQTRSVALAPLLGLALWAGAIEWPQANAEASHRSGYALTEQSCGQAPNAYPKLRIGMREGYCAGLVASGEDGLVFPRSIAQIPGHRQFVVADMGGWDPGRGPLLLLDPDAAPGKRISETGRIFVSVGAPTDSCLKPISTPCAARRGRSAARTESPV